MPLNTGLVPGLAGSIVTGRAAEVLSFDTRQFPRYTPPPPGVASSTVSPGPAKDKARAREHRSGTTELAGQEVWLADFDPATTRKIQAAALGAFQAVGGRDYSRVDVMVRPNGEPAVLEVNTLPGMTELSLFPKAAAAAGIDYPELCQRMVDMALRRGVGMGTK